MKATTKTTKMWNVRVHRNGRSQYLGRVNESTEEYARCAALSTFGRADDEPASDDTIGPDDDFDVTPA